MPLLWEVVLFGVVLFAYAAQTSLSSALQTTLGYHQSYFLLWTTHSAYVVILPLNVAVLWALKGPEKVDRAKRELVRALRKDSEARESQNGWRKDTALTALLLTFLIAIPALSWYVALPFSTPTDITAIYNCFAIWAYILSIRHLSERPTPLKLFGILLAVAGVFTLTYGDYLLSSKASDTPPTLAARQDGEPEKTTGQRLFGNGLALLGSISYAFYEIYYKGHVTLRVPAGTEAGNKNGATGGSGVPYESLRTNEEAEEDDDWNPSAISIPKDGEDDEEPLSTEPDDMDEDARDTSPYRPNQRRTLSTVSTSSFTRLTPPATPAKKLNNTTFLLHTSLMTSLIGLFTLTILALPFPILHWTGLEPFRLPPNGKVTLFVACNAAMGVAFNSGFMVLILRWGPVIASVGNLCTLVLVAFAEMVITGHLVTLWTAIGCGMIVAGFVSLVLGGGPEEGEH